MKSKPTQLSVPLLCLVLFMTSTGCKQQSDQGIIPFNEDSVRGNVISIQQAIGYTSRFRNARDSFYRQLPALVNSLNIAKAEAFNRDAIAVLLNQKDSAGNPAAGVRIYYGLDTKGRVKVVLVPYDRKGNDLIRELIGNKAVSIPGISSANAFAAGGQAVENGQRCPTTCDDGSSGLTGGN